MDKALARAVIWDMDGTLVDTAELHYRAWVQVAAEVNKPFSHADFVATFGRRNPEILRLLFGENLSDRDVAQLGDRKEELYRDLARQGVRLLPGVQPLLAALEAAGFRQAIGSSAPRRNLDLILELTGSTGYFDAVVAMEDTQRGKPDPQVFLVAAQKLAVPPAACLVIEDAVAGVQAAAAARMKCIAVTFAGHHPEHLLRQAGADRVVPNLSEVSVDLVQQLLRAAGIPGSIG